MAMLALNLIKAADLKPRRNCRWQYYFIFGHPKIPVMASAASPLWSYFLVNSVNHETHANCHCKSVKMDYFILPKMNMTFTHQRRSTNPPWAAMAAFTLLANCTASSPFYKGTIKRKKVQHSRYINHPIVSETYASDVFHVSARLLVKRFTSLFIGGRYQTLQTMAQLLIILSR